MYIFFSSEGRARVKHMWIFLCHTAFFVTLIFLTLFKVLWEGLDAFLWKSGQKLESMSIK